MEVIFAPAAIADIWRIRDYIGMFNPTAAERMAHRLIEAGETLADFPDRGRPGSIPSTRELVVIHPYVLVYEIRGEAVHVLRVWHGAQNRQG